MFESYVSRIIIRYQLIHNTQERQSPKELCSQSLFCNTKNTKCGNTQTNTEAPQVKT